MNCHAGYIIRNIKRYNHKILNDYDIYHINYASGTYLIDQNLTNNNVELIKKADVLINKIVFGN